MEEVERRSRSSTPRWKSAVIRFAHDPPGVCWGKGKESSGEPVTFSFSFCPHFGGFNGPEPSPSEGGRDGRGRFAVERDRAWVCVTIVPKGREMIEGISPQNFSNRDPKQRRERESEIESRWAGHSTWALASDLTSIASTTTSTLPIAHRQLVPPSLG